VHHYIVTLYVKQLGRGTLFRFAYRHILPGQQAADFAFWIVHVPGDDGVFRADNNAGRFQANVGAVGAVMAFGRRAIIGVNVDGVVGAGLHTRLAANADAVVELYDAVGALVHGLGGADTYAGRVGAMVAARHLKMAARIGIGPCFYVFNPGTIHAQRDFVFTFTGGRKGVAANTFAVVDEEAVVFGGRASGR